jgi:C4-dicarboxylate-specific signal transduction histidine kinase
LDDIQVAFENWLDVSASFYGEGRQAIQKGTEQEVLSLANRVVSLTTEMVDQAHIRLKVKSDEVSGSVHNAWVVLCITLVAALLFGGVVAFHLQRRLTKPVIELLSGIERSRKESVMHDFKMEADVEFQQLGHAFNQAYRELKSAQDGILQAEKMAAVGKLAAGVAHEVGNPLASISSVVQLMRRRCQSEDQLQQIDLIMDHIRRISGFVRELLNFTRPPKDDKRDMVDIVAMLDQAVSLLGYDERSKEVRVISEYDEDLMKVSANADRLTMVFTNIIVNAFDAMAGH